MNSLLYICLLCSLPLTISQIVNTSKGKLRGYTMRSTNGDPINVFKSVPFASPPVGQLRYSKPVDNEPWSGVRDATKYSAACMSNTSATTSPQKYISEDCLYLNIFKSQRCTEKRKCPVIVYIHGGALYYDSATMFNDQVIADNFASKEIVMIFPAYRIGSFGLFTTKFEDLTPRILAVHDIVKALEYVNKEIGVYGGDNTQVTIMGNSAGADLAMRLAFSKDINGESRLFQQAVVMSPAGGWMTDEEYYEKSWTLVKKSGCGDGSKDNRDDVIKALECLKSKTGAELIEAQRRLEDEDNILFNGFSLGLPFTNSTTSLKEYLSNPPAIRMILGSTSGEFAGEDIPGNIRCGDIIGLNNELECEQKYFTDIWSKKYEPHRNYKSQSVYVVTRNYAIEMTTRTKAETFLYYFDQPIHSNHAADLFYVLGIHPFEMNSDEELIMGFHSELFANFTKFGRPSPNWDPVTPGLDNYFHISVNQSADLYPKMRTRYGEKFVKYWNDEMYSFDSKVTVFKTLKNADKSLPYAYMKGRVAASMNEEPPSMLMAYIIIGFILVLVVLALVNALCCHKNNRVESETSPLLQ